MLSFNSNLNIIFAGTPDFAVPALSAIHHSVCAVLTQPDKPKGRGQKLGFSPVKQFAAEHGINVLQPTTLKDATIQQTLRELKPDVIIVIAYGLLLPQVVLDIPRLGCINVHASLLPRWRGAAPIQRAIEAGDTETGVSIMQMTAGLDEGPVFLKKPTAITTEDTAQTLHDRLSSIGVDALLEVLNHFSTPMPQNAQQAIYAHKIEKTDGLLDWNLPTETLERKIRAFNPWPVAYSYLDKQPIRIWKSVVGALLVGAHPGTITAIHRDNIEVATKNGTLHLLEIQLPGKRVCAVHDILNAHNHPFVVGKRFETI